MTDSNNKNLHTAFDDNNTRSGRELVDYLVYLSDCGKQQAEIGFKDDAREKYEHVLKLALNTEQDEHYSDILKLLFATYRRLGYLNREEGKLEEAKNEYIKAYDIGMKLCEIFGSDSSDRLMCVICDLLGDLFRDENNIAEAKNWFVKSLEFCSPESADIEMKSYIAIVCDKLGAICEEEGELSTAKMYYKKELQLYSSVATEIESDAVKRAIGYCYASIGGVCMDEDNVAEAKGYYEKGLEMRLALTAETHSSDDYDDLAGTYLTLSVLDADKKFEHIDKSVEIYERLAKEHPDNERYKNRLDMALQYKSEYSERSENSCRSRFKSIFRKK